MTRQDLADSHDELLASLLSLVVVRLLNILIAAKLEQELLDKALHAVVLLFDFLHDRHLAAVDFAQLWLDTDPLLLLVQFFEEEFGNLLAHVLHAASLSEEINKVFEEFFIDLHLGSLVVEGGGHPLEILADHSGHEVRVHSDLDLFVYHPIAEHFGKITMCLLNDVSHYVAESGLLAKAVQNVDFIVLFFLDARLLISTRALLSNWKWDDDIRPQITNTLHELPEYLHFRLNAAQLGCEDCTGSIENFIGNSKGFVGFIHSLANIKRRPIKLPFEELK